MQVANIDEAEEEVESAQLKMMDRELANIVLVKKHEMEKWLVR